MSGKQYINTHFIPDENTRVVLNCTLFDKTVSMFLFGARTAEKNKAYVLGTYIEAPTLHTSSSKNDSNEVSDKINLLPLSYSNGAYIKHLFSYAKSGYKTCALLNGEVITLAAHSSSGGTWLSNVQNYYDANGEIYMEVYYADNNGNRVSGSKVYRFINAKTTYFPKFSQPIISTSTDSYIVSPDDVLTASTIYGDGVTLTLNVQTVNSANPNVSSVENPFVVTSDLYGCKLYAAANVKLSNTYGNSYNTADSDITESVFYVRPVTVSPEDVIINDTNITVNKPSIGLVTGVAYLLSGETAYKHLIFDNNTSVSFETNGKTLLDVRYYIAADDIEDTIIDGVKGCVYSDNLATMALFSIPTTPDRLITPMYFNSEYGSTSLQPSKSVSGKCTIDKNKNVIIIDGTSFSHEAESFKCNLPLYLGTINDGGIPHYDGAIMSVDSCQIYDSDTLKHNILPYRKKNEIGFFDEITKEFFPNCGEGSFLANITDVISKPYYSDTEITTGGEDVSPTWIDYDENKMIIGGTITANTPGTYSTTFTLREGYVWDDYTNNPITIEWSASIKLPDKDTLSNMSWTDIQTICKAGKASDYWAIGDQKTILINNVEYVIDLIGFNHDTPTDINAYGRSTAGATFQLHTYLNTSYAMNPTETNEGGWEECNMRQTLLPTFFEQLESDLKNVIVAVNKETCCDPSNSTSKSITSDKLFLLSEYEVRGSIYYAVVNEGKQYVYYTNDESSYKTEKYNNGEYRWWYRSAYETTRFICNEYETRTYIRANSTAGVSFAFCV